MTLDEIDRSLLRAIKAGPGRAAYVVVRPLKARSGRVYRERLDKLAACGLVRLDRTAQRGRVLCYLTDAGEAACTP
jgi:hypothetical protein